MTRFIIERQFLLPVYQHLEIEAPDFAAACREAIERNDNWDSAEHDYDNSRETTLTRAVELPEGYDLGDGLANALYDRGLTPLPLPGDELLSLQAELDDIDPPVKP